MITGTRTIMKPLPDALDRLRLILASRGCHISQSAGNHEVYFHWSPHPFEYPLAGVLCLTETSGGTRIDYDVGVTGIMCVLAPIWAVLFCWTVFFPIMVFLAFFHRPRAFVEDILNGV